MKKVKSRKADGRAKSKGAAKNFAEYLAGVPVPEGATEIMSYGIPAFRNRVVLVWFAAFSDHYSLFPTAAVIEEFKTELKGFSTSKGTVHFPTGKPVPVVLVKKLVKARVAQAEKKKKR